MELVLLTQKGHSQEGLDYGRLHTLGSPAAQPSPTHPHPTGRLTEGLILRVCLGSRRLPRDCTGLGVQEIVNKISRTKSRHLGPGDCGQ